MRRDAIVCLVLVLLLLSEPGRAQQNASAAPSQPSLEYQVKAAFLLNFAKFIEWAPSEAAPSDSPFAICVIGEDPFGLVIEQIIQGETVNGRKLAVQRITTESPETAKSCQIVYVGKVQGIKELLSGIGPGVLTVGEGDAFIRDGGMIAFVLDHRRVRFIINLSAARNGQLTLSSRLLAVAKSVEK